MNARRRFAFAPAALAAGALWLLAGCGPRTHIAPTQRASEDRFDVITSLRIEDGHALNRRETPLPPGAYRYGLFARRSPGLRRLPGPHEKIHPDLMRRLALGPSTSFEDVLVTFQDTLHIPRFPTFSAWSGTTPSDTSSKLNSAVALVQQIRTTRQTQRDADSAAVVTRFNATVLDNSFWLTRSVRIRVLRDSIPSLAASPGVVYVRPNVASEHPPQMNGSLLDNPDRVRAWVGADPYFVPELQRGKLALLDTGVNTDHEMLHLADQFDVRADCVHLDASGNPSALGLNSDLSPGDGHGTMSAGIINGRSPYNAAARGLSQITIDSYRIYRSDPADPNGEPVLDATALSHSLETLFSSFGGVVTVEAQAVETDVGGISQAADQAFDGGAVIVAANGNIDDGDPTPKVRAPANARRALGIGAYSVRYGNDAVEQIQGPAPDLRIKPDLQAPTSYETASAASRTAYGGHGGTSGATAVAGGAAALFRNLLLGEDASVDPGYVYAGLIACGDRLPPFNNTNGAGHFRLPNDSWFWMVKVSLSNDEHSYVELDASGLDLTRVAAGIWWPERAKWVGGVQVDSHSDVSLRLKVADAGESSYGFSGEKESVFQRADVQVAAPVTSLVADIHARTVRDGPQTVYLVVLGYLPAVP